jgi:fructose/tagatose bisphosphate aldolase
MIVASQKLECHVEKELGILFSEESKDTKMYGEKELEEILATIKALAEPAR